MIDSAFFYYYSARYVMLDGVNDSIQDARRLVKILRDLPAHVNLMQVNLHMSTTARANLVLISPFNPWPGTKYRTSTNAQVDAFEKRVIQSGIFCSVRRPRGSGKKKKKKEISNIASLFSFYQIVGRSRADVLTPLTLF